MRIAFGSRVTAATASAPIIVARDVTRAFDGRTVVRGLLTFEVEAGTILGLIGPSGSGKTTTIRMLTGYARANPRERRASSARIRSDSSRGTRGRLAYMPQLFSLYEDLSAQTTSDFVAALYGIGPFRRGRLHPASPRGRRPV